MDILSRTSLIVLILIATLTASWAAQDGIVSARAVADGTGLSAIYFANTGFSGNPAVQRIDYEIDFDWGAGSPASLIPADGFSARWKGEIDISAPGEYTFYVEAPDAVRLWLNGQLIIDRWASNPASKWSVTVKVLNAARIPIRLDHYKTTGNAAIRLTWSSKTFAEALVPRENLHPFRMRRHDLARWQSYMEGVSVPTGGYAFAAARNGKIVASGTRGFARMPYETVDPGLPWTLQTRLLLASVSKSICATSLMKLWEERNRDFSIDDPFWPILASRIPMVDESVKRVTLRHLLNHTSGITTSANGGGGSAFEQTLAQPTQWEPGTAYSYNNWNFYLIQKVIETLSGETLENYARNHLLAPMGITDMSAIPTAPAALAYKTGFPGAAGSLFSLKPEDNLGFAAWWASVEDLLKFLAGIRGNKAISRETAEFMLHERLGWYSWGVADYTAVAGHGHNGGWSVGKGEISTTMMLFEDGLDVVLLLNSDAGNPFDQVRNLWFLEAAGETSVPDRAPTLSWLRILRPANRDGGIKVSYDWLRQNSDATDLDLDALRFEVLPGSIQGTLWKNGTAATDLGPGEEWTWLPPLNPTRIEDALSLKVSASGKISGDPVALKIDLGDVTVPPRELWVSGLAISPDGMMEFDIAGSGVSARIESSNDLKRWTPKTVVPLLSGKAKFSQPAEGNVNFYRASLVE